MADLREYLQKRGIIDDDMEAARGLTREKIEATAPSSSDSEGIPSEERFFSGSREKRSEPSTRHL